MRESSRGAPAVGIEDVALPADAALGFGGRGFARQRQPRCRSEAADAARTFSRLLAQPMRRPRGLNIRLVRQV